MGIKKPETHRKRKQFSQNFAFAAREIIFMELITI